MTPARRWCLVALTVALIVGIPLGLRALPAEDSDVSAPKLFARVQDSFSHPYSGYVESLGTLQLPVADRFTDVGALFGERTRMRVWWRGSDDWRVDKILATGETDFYHDGAHTTVWEYEKLEATQSRDPGIRLPRASDLVPPELARRLLGDADPSDLSRLDARHVAGLDALGLRLTLRAPQSSIDHIDLWVDARTAIPLRVEVYAKGATTSALTSEFLTFSPSTPDASTTRFTAPPGVDTSSDDVLDIADAANQFAPIAPPRSLAGLDQSPDAKLRAVGVYGSGVTQLIAIPLWERAADPLRAQLKTTPGARLLDDKSILLGVGPLSVLLTQNEQDCSGWLIAGTVTQETATTAARQLADRIRVIR